MDLIATILIGVLLFMCFYLFWMWFCFGNCVKKRQKTRNPQQRRIYAGSRPRASLTPHEPTIYVSPSNLPPPPKYECMAPPSYEEVVGVHYPNLQQQPIAQPITAALAQNAQSNNSNTPANNAPVQPINNPVPTTATVTTVNERQTTTSS